MLQQHDIEQLQREGRLDSRIGPRIAGLVVALALITPALLPQLKTVFTGEDGSGPDFRRRMVHTLVLLLGVDDRR